MKFPETSRVIYEKNPLAEVVCQFRFPRVLAVDETIPAEFQTILGADYPFVETKEVVQVSFAEGGETSTVKRTHYAFSTIDKHYVISLSSDSIAITTLNYERWEHFVVHIKHAISTLLKVYPIAFFTRIGLRYVDVISRNALSLSEERWSDLIKPSAIGLLHENAVPISDIIELSAASVFKLNDSDKVLLRTGLGKVEKTGDETVFIIDGDFFRDEPVKGLDDAIAVCGSFNKSAGSAFRWIIRDPLHEALGPRPPS